MLSLLMGSFLIASTIYLTVRLYFFALKKNIVPALVSETIEQLARKKLLLVLIVSTSFELLLFWYVYLLILSTLPIYYLDILGDFVGYALLLSLCPALFIAAAYFQFRNRLLTSWLPNSMCPQCQEKTSLVDHWQCVGGCRVTKERHVLTPCPTCGTKTQGLACSNNSCSHLIVFSEPYNEFAVVNKANKYVTEYNPRFWITGFVLSLALLFLYLCFQAELTFFLYLFGIISLAAIGTLLALKPKRLVANPYYIEESQQWIAKASA